MQVEQTTDDDEAATDIEIKLESGTIFTRLTETVRNHYRSYLEKQLLENVRIWSEKSADAGKCGPRQHNIQQCAKELEERAVRACVMAQMYQRTMVKVIANVHDYTKACRLESHLLKINAKDCCSDLAAHLTNKSSQTTTTTHIAKPSTASKATQTETDDLKAHPPGPHKTSRSAHSLAPPAPKHRPRQLEVPPPLTPPHADDYTSLSLQQKIEMFQAQLNKKKAAEVAAYRMHAAPPPPPPHHLELRRTARHKRRRTTLEVSSASRHPPHMLPPPAHPLHVLTPPLSHTRSLTATPQPLSVSTSVISSKTEFNETLPHLMASTPAPEPEDDLIAQELEQIFNEENTELDEIFGIHSSVPDDPQICSILREIENAKMPHERPKLATPSSSPPAASTDGVVVAASSASPVAFQKSIKAFSVAPPSPLRSPTLPNAVVEKSSSATANAAAAADADAELHRSLWPCELFMQRRRLSASLSRLIEEDFRWHELIKWKFATLFGDDSDDEFAAYSPSIELDEVLISSCIRRISPWMVKHLMTPMHDGLIANRFLFKKLAKRLGRSIVMENQYPDERTIKRAVEKYFCLHQAVMSADDLADIPSISFKDED